MDIPLILKPVLSFLGYLLSSGAMLGLFVWIYAQVTPYREFELIAKNNNAAAIALGGAVIGFPLPLVSAIYFTRSIVEMAIWGIITGIVQLLVFLALRRKAREIEAGHTASAILLATFSISIGLLNAASISY